MQFSSWHILAAPCIYNRTGNWIVQWRNCVCVVYCVLIVHGRAACLAAVFVYLRDMDLPWQHCCEAARCLSQTAVSGWNFERLYFWPCIGFPKVLLELELRSLFTPCWSFKLLKFCWSFKYVEVSNRSCLFPGKLRAQNSAVKWNKKKERKKEERIEDPQ